MANPKQKGSSFERDVANRFTKVFGDKFYRTAHSGAFTGGVNSYRAEGLGSATKAFLGDIIPPDGYNVVIECKNYGDIPFHNIIQGECLLLDGWIAEVQRDSKETPHMVVFKINYCGIYMCLPQKHFPNISNYTISHCVYYTVDNEVYYVVAFGYIECIREYLKSVIKQNESEVSGC